MFRLPLYAVRILDLTMAWAGPYANRLLRDMGAEVIKVEAVNNWDLLRSFTGQPPTVEHVWDKSPYFNHVNRDKYGCVLDLSQEKGRELFLRLAAISDVVKADGVGSDQSSAFRSLSALATTSTSTPSSASGDHVRPSPSTR